MKCSLCGLAMREVKRKKTKHKGHAHRIDISYRCPNGHRAYEVEGLEYWDYPFDWILGGRTCG